VWHCTTVNRLEIIERLLGNLAVTGPSSGGRTVRLEMGEPTGTRLCCKDRWDPVSSCSMPLLPGRARGPERDSWATGASKAGLCAS
jgi:hypothetical protein